MYKAFIHDGADINKKDKNGRNCLYNFYKDIKVYKLLFDHGIEININDKKE